MAVGGVNGVARFAALSSFFFWLILSWSQKVIKRVFVEVLRA